MKILRIIKTIAGIAFAIGIAAIPGAIEFSDWIAPIAMIVGGGIIFWTIDRSYYFEDDDKEDFDDSKYGPYSDDVNDFYGY